MTLLQSRFYSPFDILFKDFFNNSIDGFSPLSERKIDYPVDIKRSDDKIIIDIAAVGIDRDDIQIEVEDDFVLRVSYEKKEQEEDETFSYIQNTIARRSFNFAWKISRNYDLSKINAKMRRGILSLEIPKSEEKIKKLIAIQ